MGKISSYIRWMSGQSTVCTYFPRMFTVTNRFFLFFSIGRNTVERALLRMKYGRPALTRRSYCWECTDEEETIHSVIKKVSWTKVITRSGASKRKEKVNKGQSWGNKKKYREVVVKMRKHDRKYENVRELGKK